MSGIGAATSVSARFGAGCRLSAARRAGVFALRRFGFAGGADSAAFCCCAGLRALIADLSSPSPRITAIGVLTATSAVPSGTRILPSVPSSAASTSIVALSVSISAMTSPDLTVSPSFLSHLARLPFSIVGDSAGMRTSVGMSDLLVRRSRRNVSGRRRCKARKRRAPDRGWRIRRPRLMRSRTSPSIFFSSSSLGEFLFQDARARHVDRIVVRAHLRRLPRACGISPGPTSNGRDSGRSAFREYTGPCRRGTRRRPCRPPPSPRARPCRRPARREY